MSIAFVPVYIRYLGIESYGLIGIFAVLQSWLALLDMGLAPTLSREMAKYTGGNQNSTSIRDLLRSVEVVAGLIAALIVIVLLLSSTWLAESWLNLNSLSIAEVVNTLFVMSFVIALRFIEGLYKSCLIGLQKQVLLNILNCLLVTFRSIGAIVVLIFVAPTITVFFLWQALISLASVSAFIFFTYSSIPPGERAGKFSHISLQGIIPFARGMFFITLMSLLLMQSDKIILSSLLDLTEYGFYMLASTVAGALYMAIQPISQLWFPRLTEKFSSNDFTGLETIYHQGCQLVSVVMGSTAIVLIFFSNEIIYLWTQNIEITHNASKIVRILVLGNLLNGLMWIPYQTQLAYGWTSLASMINLVGVILMLPLLFWIAPLYGAEGAAWLWVSLNMGYVLIGVNFMFRKILKTARLDWYLKDTLIPLGVATLLAVFFRIIFIQTAPIGNTFMQLLILAMVFSIILLVSALSTNYIRTFLVQLYHSSLKI